MARFRDHYKDGFILTRLYNEKPSVAALYWPVSIIEKPSISRNLFVVVQRAVPYLVGSYIYMISMFHSYIYIEFPWTDGI